MILTKARTTRKRISYILTVTEELALVPVAIILSVATGVIGPGIELHPDVLRISEDSRLAVPDPACLD